VRKSLFSTWYPITFSNDIKPNKIYSLKLLNEPLILYKDQQNKIACLQDRCPHRSTPLSLGRLNEGNIECLYHGWQFNRKGECIRIPAQKSEQKISKRSCVPYKHVLEKEGLVWVYIGQDAEPEFDQQLCDPLNYHDKNTIRFDFSMDVQIPHELMVENLLDPAHLPFAHHGTLSNRKKASPITFKIKKENNCIQGVATTLTKEQEKQFHFNFIAPYIVYFDINFSNKGMRQVHYCLPLTPDTMRLNSVFYYKNMSWLRWIPFIKYFQSKMSKKIVIQDIAMLKGQNNNLLLNAKPWNYAINADKLGVAYRNWFEQEIKVASPWFNGFSTHPIHDSCAKK